MAHKQINEAQIVEAAILKNETLVETIQDSAEDVTEAITVDGFKEWLDQTQK